MTTLNKYIWLANELIRAGERGISLKTLNEHWMRNVELSGGMVIPRKTFDRWKGGVEDLFGVDIQNENHGEYRYFIRNPERLRQGTLGRWLLDTYTTANALMQNQNISGRILAEDIPSSQEFLVPIMEAMKRAGF